MYYRKGEPVSGDGIPTDGISAEVKTKPADRFARECCRKQNENCCESAAGIDNTADWL